MLNSQRVIFVILIFVVAHAHAENTQLIVNVSSSVDSLSRNTARAIFSMRVQRWEDDNPITVFVLTDTHPLHRQFAREKLSLFPHQLRRSWDRYVYSGIGMAPYELENEEAMLDKVATTPGSIGYTSREVSNENIRMVPIE